MPETNIFGTAVSETRTPEPPRTELAELRAIRGWVTFMGVVTLLCLIGLVIGLVVMAGEVSHLTSTVTPTGQ